MYKIIKVELIDVHKSKYNTSFYEVDAILTFDDGVVKEYKFVWVNRSHLDEMRNYKYSKTRHKNVVELIKDSILSES